MDYYDPAMHEPIEVECGESTERAPRVVNTEQRDLAIHSKHVWFGQWQDKMLGLLREPE